MYLTRAYKTKLTHPSIFFHFIKLNVCDYSKLVQGSFIQISQMLRDDHRNHLENNMNYQQHSTTANFSNYQLAAPVLATPVAARRILRLKQLMDLTGLSRSAIYDRLDPKSRRYDASFPKQIKLGGSTNSAVGWVESEILIWLDQCCGIR